MGGRGIPEGALTPPGKRGVPGQGGSAREHSVGRSALLSASSLLAPRVPLLDRARQGGSRPVSRHHLCRCRRRRSSSGKSLGCGRPGQLPDGVLGWVRGRGEEVFWAEGAARAEASCEGGGVVSTRGLGEKRGKQRFAAGRVLAVWGTQAPPGGVPLIGEG